MPQARITVKKVYVNDKGPCKLIDHTGMQWKFWKPGKYGGIAPDKFVEDASYNIGYEVKPFDGKDEFYIKTISEFDTGSQGPAPANQPPVQYGIGSSVTYQSKAAAPTMRGGIDKFVTAEGAVPTGDQRGDDIATMALVKEWIGRIPVGDEAALVHALRVCRRAWLKFKANPNNIDTHARPSMKDEMRDEIPYQEFPEDR